MSLRWSLCQQPTLGHQGNLSSCQLDDPQLPTEILTYGHPKLDGWHPGRRRRDGAGAGAEGRGSEQGAEAARQATGAAGSGAFPKTGRRRLALWRAGVADRGRDESSWCAAGRDREERRAGGQRTVSAAPEARRPGLTGWRDRSSTLSRACCGLRRWTMSGALFCPHCRPAPGTHGPSCAQLGPRCGAFDLPPARAGPAVGSRVQGKRRAMVCESPSTDALCTCANAHDLRSSSA